jgi:hypothetical protein
MPVLIDQQEITLEWADLFKWVNRPQVKSPRSSGVHVSGVIKYVLQTSGFLNKEDATDDCPWCIAVGVAMENYLVGLWPPELIWQPGEQNLDGIYASPDGITGAQLEEFKATWKSQHTRPDITKERIWMWQMAAYCKMMGLTRARLHVFWMNGNYRPPFPKYVTYTLQYSQQELDRFWANVILKNKDKATAEAHL